MYDIVCMINYFNFFHMVILDGKWKIFCIYNVSFEIYLINISNKNNKYVIYYAIKY